MKSLSLLALFLFGVNSKSISSFDTSNKSAIVLPFYQIGGEYFVTFHVGTPEQKVYVSLKYFDTDHDLRLSWDDFQKDDSRTWYEIGKYPKHSKRIGLQGQDNIRLSNQTFNDFDLVLMDYDLGFTGSYLGFRPSESFFWSELLPKLPSHEVSVVMSENLTHGFLTFGGLDIENCGQWWEDFDQQIDTIEKEGRNETRFGILIQKISTGSFTYYPKPTKLVFKMDNSPIVWGRFEYDNILNSLGSLDGETVPCNGKQDIKFQLKSNFTIYLTPEDYLVNNGDGTCKLTGKVVDGHVLEYSLTNAIFSKYCVAIDHSKKVVKLIEKHMIFQ